MLFLVSWSLPLFLAFLILFSLDHRQKKVSERKKEPLFLDDASLAVPHSLSPIKTAINANTAERFITNKSANEFPR